jgi:hypothetical protein
MTVSVNRRDFAKGFGGIVLAFTLDPALAQQQQQKPLPGSLGGNRMLDAWIRINADGSVPKDNPFVDRNLSRRVRTPSRTL